MPQIQEEMSTSVLEKAISALKEAAFIPNEPSFFYVSFQTYFIIKNPELYASAKKLSKNPFDKRTKGWNLIKEKYLSQEIHL